MWQQALQRVQDKGKTQVTFRSTLTLTYYQLCEPGFAPYTSQKPVGRIKNCVGSTKILTKGECHKPIGPSKTHHIFQQFHSNQAKSPPFQILLSHYGILSAANHFFQSLTSYIEAGTPSPLVCIGSIT